MENPQVRFSNISIKASDEFMTAVDEQRKYGDEEYIVYKKLNKEVVKSAPQDEKGVHYSSGIPSKHHNNRLRQDVIINQLPDILNRIRRLEKILPVTEDNSIDIK